MASSPEKIAAGVYRVDAIRFPNAINVLLLENDDGWTLVDTGVGLPDAKERWDARKTSANSADPKVA